MRYITSAFCFAFLIGTPVAFANPMRAVDGAGVQAGRTQVEFRFAASSDSDDAEDDGRIQLRQHIDHAFNNWYALRMSVGQDNRGGDRLEHNAIVMENRVQLFNNKEDGFDGGFRFVYTNRDGDKKPDSVDVRWIYQKPFATDYEFTSNIILQHQIGQQSRRGLMPELRWQVVKRVLNGQEAGFEMFNGFGNIRDHLDFQEQSHEFGVVMSGPFFPELFGNAYHQTGYRHGVSRNSPDHSFKFYIGYNF